MRIFENCAMAKQSIGKETQNDEAVSIYQEIRKGTNVSSSKSKMFHHKMAPLLFYLLGCGIFAFIIPVKAEIRLTGSIMENEKSRKLQNVCLSWCEGHESPWRHPNPNVRQKCGWPQKCAGCPQCRNDFVSTQPSPSPSKPCLTWCENNETPWTDPNPDASQKCNWPNACSGCSQCISTQSIILNSQPSSSEPTPAPSLTQTISPTKPCLPWCDSHGAPWTDKCDWPFTCGGCNPCESLESGSDVTSIPSFLASSSPSQIESNIPSTIFSSPPTIIQSLQPSSTESSNPTLTRSLFPSILSSSELSFPPTVRLSMQPSLEKSFEPSIGTSFFPTQLSSSIPSYQLSQKPSNFTPQPTQKSSSTPSNFFTKSPTPLSSSNPSFSPTNICKSWCAPHPTPWKDPDPAVSQKCRWPFTCGGCLECGENFESNPPTPSPTKACLPWCVENPAPWFDPDPSTSQKCNWPASCGGCSECAIETSPPTPQPTFPPTTLNPTSKPTPKPTPTPTMFPSNTPTRSPTPMPTPKPTRNPTRRPKPTPSPTTKPTRKPTPMPSPSPTISPSSNPTVGPSESPTFTGSFKPTISSSNSPSIHPTFDVSTNPTSYPSLIASSSPTISHTTNPTPSPTIQSSSPPSNIGIITQKVSTTFFTNFRADGTMDEETMRIFEDTTIAFLKELEKELGTDEVQVVITDVNALDQLKSESNTSEGIQLLTKKRALETTIVWVMEHGTSAESNGNRRLEETEVRQFLLVELSVDAEISIISENDNNYSFDDRLFQVMKNDIDEYASRLASASSFFEKVLAVIPLPVSPSQSQTIRSSKSIITVAAAMGALMGTLAILLCGSVIFRKYRGVHSPRWREPRPIQEVWPSFSSWNSPNDEEKLANVPIHREPKGFLRMRSTAASTATDPYPTSIHLSRQDSFSTISNYGLHSQNMDAFGASSKVKAVEKRTFSSKDEEESINVRKPLALRRVPNLSINENADSFSEELSNVEVKNIHFDEKQTETHGGKTSTLAVIDAAGEADIISIVSSSRSKKEDDSKDNQNTDETADESYTCLITISVPPGYLGLILEKHEDGGPLTCSRVKLDSPLVDMVQEGDIIASMDGVDIQGMSVYEFTSYLKQTMKNSTRIMKVIGNRTSGFQIPDGLMSF